MANPVLEGFFSDSEVVTSAGKGLAVSLCGSHDLLDRVFSCPKDTPGLVATVAVAPNGTSEATAGVQGAHQSHYHPVPASTNSAVTVPNFFG